MLYMSTPQLLSYALISIMTVVQVGLELLDLGICPRLSVLQIEAPSMLVLELKGCGMLSEAYISCPCLKSLDASFCRLFTVISSLGMFFNFLLDEFMNFCLFCRNLSDESLARTARSCLQIGSLVLSSCLPVAFDGLSSLHLLRHLVLLDLSYTFVTDLQPVFDNCFKLAVSLDFMFLLSLYLLYLDSYL